MEQKKVREIALELLMRIDKQGGFSHLILSDAIEKAKLDIRDESLLTEIVYGTIERKITIDYYLVPFMKQSKKREDWVITLLRLSVFQLAFLDKVPAFAVINEAVQIAKRKGHKGIGSFVNGILRNIDRSGFSNIDDIRDPIEHIHVATSHPKWLVERWVSSYGMETTKQMCETNLKKKPIYVRINRNKISREQMMETLTEEGFEVSCTELVKDGLALLKGNILKTPYIEEGLLTIQDQSSMLAAHIVEPEENMKVLDACSAPGGKATYLAEQMNNTGEVQAHDLHKNKINLIKKNANRLGLSNIMAQQLDARQLQTVYDEEVFDRILVDAPCSGFGVIRSKPDIKYNKQLEDIIQLQKVQSAILHQVAPLLKSNGKLVYSTCTIDKMENEDVIKQFLDTNEAYQVDKTFLDEVEKLENVQISAFGVQIFPQSYNSDGFFMTRLTKLLS